MKKKTKFKSSLKTKFNQFELTDYDMAKISKSFLDYEMQNLDGYRSSIFTDRDGKTKIEAFADDISDLPTTLNKVDILWKKN